MDQDLVRLWTYEREYGYIRARLRLSTPAEGGRNRPIYSGYRSCWGFPRTLHENMHDGPLLIEDSDVLSPGGVANIRLHPLLPAHWPKLSNGIELGMFEGSRRVGDAVVLEIVGPGN